MQIDGVQRKIHPHNVDDVDVHSVPGALDVNVPGPDGQTARRRFFNNRRLHLFEGGRTFGEVIQPALELPVAPIRGNQCNRDDEHKRQHGKPGDAAGLRGVY